MPLIRIENWPKNPVPKCAGIAVVPEGFKENWKAGLATDVRKAGAKAGVPGIDESKISVVFGGQQILEDDKMMILFVEGMFDQPDRTKEVRDRFARLIVEATLEYVTIGWSVEALVGRFNTSTDSFHVGKKMRSKT